MSKTTPVNPRKFRTLPKAMEPGNPAGDTANPLKDYRCFIGTPCGDAFVDFGLFKTTMGVYQSPFPVMHMPNVRSSLTANFNMLLCEALNSRNTHGITHFVMVHSDVVPAQSDWLARLLTLLAVQHPEWQCLSTIIPIKSNMGLTSTGWDTHRWRPRRITMKEAYKLPDTWGTTSLPDYKALGLDGDFGPLLLNTGLMIWDIRKSVVGDWPEKICFEFRNRILKHIAEDGTEWFYEDFEPEDWRFSRQLHKLGVPYGVTRSIPLSHCGPFHWGAGQPWGDLETDTINRPIVEEWKLGYEEAGYKDMLRNREQRAATAAKEGIQ